MKKSLLIASAVLTALLTAPSFEAEAVAAKTTCHYYLVAGAPWAAKSTMTVHSGHIQCAANYSTPIAHWKLSYQRHI